MAENHEKKGSRIQVRDMCLIAVFAVLLCVCSWLSIPTEVPFTLQTFAVFVTLGLLGGKRGTLAVVVYILLGAIGLPVFSGFRGGPGVLLGVTGGYIAGFLLSGLVYWILTRLTGTSLPFTALALILGLALCYLFGTIWFVAAYARTSGAIGFWAAFAKCVLPFLLPDFVKLALALLLIRRLRPVVPA